MSDTPCLIDAPHGRHDWTPIVVDPDDDHVLHVFHDAPVTCGGIDTATWLARRDTVPGPGAD